MLLRRDGDFAHTSADRAAGIAHRGAEQFRQGNDGHGDSIRTATSLNRLESEPGRREDERDASPLVQASAPRSVKSRSLLATLGKPFSREFLFYLWPSLSRAPGQWLVCGAGASPTEDPAVPRISRPGLCKCHARCSGVSRQISVCYGRFWLDGRTSAVHGRDARPPPCDWVLCDRACARETGGSGTEGMPRVLTLGDPTAVGTTWRNGCASEV